MANSGYEWINDSFNSYRVSASPPLPGVVRSTDFFADAADALHFQSLPYLLYSHHKIAPGLR